MPDDKPLSTGGVVRPLHVTPVAILITGHPHHDDTLAALEYGPAMHPLKAITMR